MTYNNEIAMLQMTSKTGGLRSDALHETAITSED